MNKALKLFLFLMVGALTGCATWDSWWGPSPYVEEGPAPMHRDHGGATMYRSDGTPVPPGESTLSRPRADSVRAGSMDSNDRTKLSRALDNPPGKSSHWENPNTGTSYTVIPTKKVTINQNPYCRHYQVTAVSNGKERQYTGTACVASDGSWQSVGG